MKKETIKDNNKDSQINFERITSFPYDFYFYKDLIQENLGLCSTFTIFKSINDILTLVYVTDDYSIISYDIRQNKQLNIIKNPQKDICNLQYCLDNKNKRDLLLSQSCYNNINIWDIDNYKCILNLKDLELSSSIINFICCILGFCVFIKKLECKTLQKIYILIASLISVYSIVVCFLSFFVKVVFSIIFLLVYT